jgi:ADP-ribose pyrophosphatase
LYEVVAANAEAETKTRLQARARPPSKKNSVTSAARIEKLCEFYISPGFLSEKMFVYLATGLRETEQQLEEDEVIEIIRVTFDVRITND